MARALSNATIAAALSDGIALMISRRGYSAASAVMGRGRHMEGAAAGKREGAAAADAVEAACSWVPDPVTGYYRPANRPGVMDAAEMREMFLSHKSRD